jgi:hypothetical protein
VIKEEKNYEEACMLCKGQPTAKRIDLKEKNRKKSFDLRLGK